ncbi:hypothetical protein RB595_007425 [Gaeumannomyces hyphopodioides]
MPDIGKPSAKSPLMPEQERSRGDQIGSTSGSEKTSSNPGTDFKTGVKNAILVLEIPQSEHKPETGRDKGKEESNPRISKIRGFIESTLKAWGLLPIYTQAISLQTTLAASKHVVIHKNRFQAFLAATIHLVPMAATAVVAWLLYTEQWVGANLVRPDLKWAKQLVFLINFSAKLLEGFITASLSAMLFTFIRYEVALGKGAPLAAYLAGGAVRNASFFWSDDLFGMARGRFSSIPKKAFFLAFSVFCCVIITFTAPLAATALLPVNDWFTTGGSDFFIDLKQYRIGDTSIPEANITSTGTLPGDVCRVAGNPKCPSEGWESMEKLAATFRNHKYLNEEKKRFFRKPPGIWSTPVPGAVMQFPLGIREDPAVPRPWGESLILMPHRAIATAVSDVMGHFWEALFLMAEVEKVERRGSKFRFWSFSPHVGALTRCQATAVAQNESLSVNGSRLIAFPDVRSKVAEKLYQNTTILDAGLDRFLSTGNSSVPRLFFFNPSTPGLWRNVSIATAISLPLEGQGLVLYGCVSSTKWIWADLETTPDKMMTTRPEPLSPGWERLATAAGLAEPGNAASRSAVTTLGHVETLVNMLLAMGLSNAGSDADAEPRLANPDGKWWLDMFLIRPIFGIFQLSNVDSRYRNGAFKHPVQNGDNQVLPLYFNAAMFGYGYSHNSDQASPLLVGLFAYSAVAVLFLLWSVGFVGVASSSWDSPLEMVALALRSPRPADEILPSSLVENPGVLGGRYCIAADGEDLLLQPMGNRQDDIGNRVLPNTPYK